MDLIMKGILKHMLLISLISLVFIEANIKELITYGYITLNYFQNLMKDNNLFMYLNS